MYRCAVPPSDVSSYLQLIRPSLSSSRWRASHLPLHQRLVCLTALDQLVVCATILDRALRHHRNLIGVTNGAQPVCDQQDRAVLRRDQGVQRLEKSSYYTKLIIFDTDFINVDTKFIIFDTKSNLLHQRLRLRVER